jgi:hypothetical protein
VVVSVEVGTLAVLVVVPVVMVVELLPRPEGGPLLAGGAGLGVAAGGPAGGADSVPGTAGGADSVPGTAGGVEPVAGVSVGVAESDGTG